MGRGRDTWQDGDKVSDSVLKRVEVDYSAQCSGASRASLEALGFGALPFTQMTQMGWCFAPDTSHVFMSDVRGR